MAHDYDQAHETCKTSVRFVKPQVCPVDYSPDTMTANIAICAQMAKTRPAFGPRTPGDLHQTGASMQLIYDLFELFEQLS